MAMQINDDMPDWLSAAHSPPRPADDPASKPAPPAGDDAPAWLRHAASVSTAHAGDRGEAPPSTGPLAIARYQLAGEPSARLQKLLDTRQIMADQLHLRRCYDAIALAERQITAYVRQSKGHALPESVDVYSMLGVADPIKRHPIQLATLLVDTLLLTSGTEETCPREARHRAILGLAEQILTQQTRLHDQEEGAEAIIGTLLDDIERVSVTLEDPRDRIRLHARKLFLRAIIAEPDTGREVRDWSW